MMAETRFRVSGQLSSYSAAVTNAIRPMEGQKNALYLEMLKGTLVHVIKHAKKESRPVSFLSLRVTRNRLHNKRFEMHNACETNSSRDLPVHGMYKNVALHIANAEYKRAVIK